LGAPVDAAFWLGMPMPAVYRFEVDAAGSWSSVGGPDCRRAGSPAVELDPALASIARGA
jgi:hypothetical protein